MDKNLKFEGYKDTSIQNDLKVGYGKSISSKKMPITEEEINKAFSTFQTYKAGKANLDARIIEEEEWWRIRHWEALRRTSAGRDEPQPTSAWTFNTIINKHADIMDNFPLPSCLPRERDDEESAKALGEVLPIILDRCNYRKVYSNDGWYFLKHGVCAEGAFWDNSIDNGLGNAIVREIDVLNLFWEPGITDIQNSENIFIIEQRSLESLIREYPEHSSKFYNAQSNLVAKYIQDESIDDSEKVGVIDWYYKKRNENGKTVLHYCKFCGNAILYASENDPNYAERGYYDHGKYPVVLKRLFPIEGTCYGFGFIAVTKDPQLYIDKLDGNILRYSFMASNPRWFIRKDSGINKDDFLDLKNVLVEVEGDINEEKVRQMTINQMDSLVVNVKQMKIDELKETSANRDVNSGGTVGGVTSGAAIATLQEAGNKVSRDMNESIYDSFKEICYLLIELIRQFYEEPRTFRIKGAGAENNYVDFDNSKIKEQEIDQEIYKMPIFDVIVTAQRKNPYSTLSQNETAANLYKMGVFNPENAQMASIMLDMMEFEGKEKVLEKICQGQTLLNLVNQLNGQLEQMNKALDQANQQANMSASEQQAPISDNVSEVSETIDAGVQASDIEQLRGQV